MANKEYTDLKNGRLSIIMKIESGKKAVETYKKMAEDPDYSASERAKHLDKYKKAVENLDKLKNDLTETEKNIKKIEGKSVLEGIKERYNKLKKRLDIQVDPESESAQKIKDEIDNLVPEFQRAYSNSIGTRVSASIAKNKLTGGKVPTLNTDAEGEDATGVESVGTNVLGEKPAATPAKGQTPAKPKTPVKTGPSSKTTAVERERESGQLFGTVDAAATADREASASKAINAPDLGLSEALFKNVPSLKAIYDKYVDPKSGMTDEEFIKRVRQDTWFLKNSKEIRARFTQFYNYQDLQASGQADGSTDYEQQIAKIESRLKKRAVELGSAAASDPIALRKAAENLYITNKSEDESYITDFLASAIRPVSGMIGGKVTEGYSGQALQNYNALLGVARNNGFQIKDILPGAQNEQQVLSAIARGEIDINRVAQDARKLAAQGQPQYVRDLLAQGYDLAQVFAPYRQQMASVLEIQDPNQIDLNDPLLRTAITDKGDMNIYDFKKALRQDSRWQYTENAKQEVSDAALGVLRDFGFQG